ncbi:helix-turn-helix domain-containing protein [Clostridium sp. YIM B02505]|uniref:Helix-turn-helix domain-containing protein n=1 Tax=Clostridium yunnanense TaxID=2800325 RepID=A0ABS1EKU1_9CLOT|nr:helix-turn-helix domain-containing protein [Clostridium yunnanense]MBK1809969.1 helix-turn-helix domain-containing protein [Clostridium yunnanense]
MVSLRSNLSSIDDIRYICRKIFGISNIPIYFFDVNGEVLFEYSYEHSQNPLYTDKHQIFSELINICNSDKFFGLKTTKYLENFFCSKIIINDVFTGTVLIGPTLSSEIDEKSISNLIKEFDIQHKFKKSLVEYYNHVVIMDYTAFLELVSLLLYQIYNYKLDFEDLQNYSELINVTYENKNSFDISQSKKRRDSVYHHSQGFEVQLLNYIKEGNVEELKEFLMSNSVGGEKGLHSKNPLRNEKNIFISFISLISHAAIEGGLDWELALSLSDFYIQAIEECNTIVGINEIYGKVLFDYTERVHKIRSENYSINVVKCKNYVFEHLYEKITVSQIADHLSMNANYLSHLFKKEVGISISEYIQKERIEEAKKLIRTGEKSLADIYAPLSFIDQSHFTKTFKKITGINPKEYKSLYQSNKK